METRDPGLSLRKRDHKERIHRKRDETRPGSEVPGARSTGCPDCPPGRRSRIFITFGISQSAPSWGSNISSGDSWSLFLHLVPVSSETLSSKRERERDEIEGRETARHSD